MPVGPPLVTDITRGSMHDGPGVRSVVYFKGCALRCAWCHNPETQRAEAEILRHASRCVGCCRCASVCPSCHTILDVACHYDRGRCAACGQCADACPAEALVLCGTAWEPQDLEKELLKDRIYYKRSGGGVTLSGGECLLYPDYAAELLSLLRESGIHTAVESALYVPWTHVERIIPFTDLFLIDLKHMDAERHRQYTGLSNALILDNLSQLARVHRNVIVRIPLIPGVNDDAENLSRTAAYVLSTGGGIRGVELLKYNPLGRAKYESLDRVAIVFGDDPQSDADMEARCILLNKDAGLERFVRHETEIILR